MTREETINKWIIPAIKNTWNEKKCNEILKSLEQEPCEDAVSRKKVIDTIYCECSCENLDIDFAKVLLLQRAIKALPSVSPQPKERK